MKKGLSETCYRFFVNLVNPTRLAILEQLMKHPMSVNELANSIGQEQSMISHNLKLLLDCNFVYTKHDKRKHIYSANKKMLEISSGLLKTMPRGFAKLLGIVVNEEFELKKKETLNE